jgi:hypothetical protein
MEQSQADEVIDGMGGIWGKADPAHLEAWNRYLLGQDYDRAIDTIIELQKSAKFWPKIAEFSMLYRSQVAYPEVKGPLFTPVTDEEKANVKRLISKMRGVLKEAGVGSHGHGGPNPCPVCGGMNPDINPRTKAERLADVEAIQARLKRGTDDRP